MKKAKSFLLGSVLGAAMVWMSTTPKGRQFRDEALKHSKTIADSAVESLRKQPAVKRSVEEIEEAFLGAYNEYIKGTPMDEPLRKVVKRVSAVSVHKKIRGRSSK